MSAHEDLLQPIDVEGLARTFQAAEPTRFFVIDDFLQPEFAEAVASSYPAYEDAQRLGHQFKAVNENLKVQITDPERFPAPVAQLNEVLASDAFLETMVRITGIEGLLADRELSGGGMHVMGGSVGRLDVHVDFNLIRERGLYRRLNILVFFNKEWDPTWGGAFELWDPEVKNCLFEAEPRFNRCVVFNTTESSFHGVRPLKAPPGVTRNSFASYYYTLEAPEGMGDFHSTLFKARPGEWWRESLLLPAERSASFLRRKLERLKRPFRRDGTDG